MPGGKNNIKDLPLSKNHTTQDGPKTITIRIRPMMFNYLTMEYIHNSVTALIAAQSFHLFQLKVEKPVLLTLKGRLNVHQSLI